jgi:2-C-methyl-D-erythritol 4-phosphate cytidylyltransferase/2-C-methyl-D-erythritol 2,4-cyclodiphosphate synthase
MDSAIFLEKALEMAHAQNAQINNLDLTIICEEPKITPYASKMTRRIAEILRLDESAVNIKATTTERLGFTGRKEGIATQAIITVSLLST